MTAQSNPQQVTAAAVELEKYIALVNKCARERLNHPIANGSPVHARILIAKLFETAESDVRLVSGTLRQVTKDGVEIYAHKPVIEQAVRFLRRPKTKLSIIIQSGALDGREENVFVGAVAADAARQGAIEITFPKAGVLTHEVPHFMEADSATYRLETGEDAKPSNSAIAAIANFGDPTTAKSLADYFTDLQNFLGLDDHLCRRIRLAPGSQFSLA